MARTPKVVEDRREQIMDAALRVFAEHGFAGSTNKDIARAAGITTGLIYHYFESKEALLKAIIEQRSPAQLVRTFPTELLDLPPELFLRQMLKQILSLAEEEKFLQVMRVYLSELIHNPSVSPLGIPAVQQGTKVLEDYLAAKMTTGELRRTDPVLATQLIIGSIMDFVLRRQVLRDPAVLRFTHKQIVDGVVALALQGLLPR